MIIYLCMEWKREGGKNGILTLRNSESNELIELKFIYGLQTKINFSKMFQVHFYFF